MKRDHLPVFAFFEVVQIVSPDHLEKYPKLLRAPVIGRVYWDDEATWIYTVYFDEGTFDFKEADLQSTGVVVDKSTIYNGASVRVSLAGDPITH